jgi:UTP:GlnB (protein PII) uridylyltransferase
VTHSELLQFIDSLPVSYRASQTDRVRQEHARLSAARARGSALVAVGAVEEPFQPPALCVVADDRPGLLSLISATVTRSGFDVLQAETYCRHRAGQAAEAVDAFRIARRTGPAPWAPLEPSEIAIIQEHLEGLLNGSIPWSAVAPGPMPAAPLDHRGTRVRFLEDEHGSLSVLEVETADRSGLLLTLARALFGQEVTIVRSEVRTLASRVLDRFTLSEFDGRAISEERRWQVQVAVLTAIDAG